MESIIKKCTLYLIVFCSICLSACHYQYQIVENQDKSQTVNSSDKSKTAESIITPYRDSLNKFMSVEIGISNHHLTTAQPQGTLGNFVCDLVFQDIPAMKEYQFLNQEEFFVLFNTRGFRAPIPKGTITVSTIYQVMPFENEIVLVHLPKGTDLEVMQTLAEKGGHPLSANTQLVVDQKKTELFLVNGKKLKEDFWIITTDYLATGGDDLSFFANATEVISTNIKLRDAILQHIKQLSQERKTVNAILDDRILFFR